MSVIKREMERTLKKRLKRMQDKAQQYAQEVAVECAEAAWRAAGSDPGDAGKAVFNEHFARVFDELYKAKLTKMLEDRGIQGMSDFVPK